MCGFSGLIEFGNPNGMAQITLVESSLEAIKHRGPDGKGLVQLAGGERGPEWVLTLGHRRLSIIDLSEDGLQPFKSKDERFVLIFNGEIYNYLEIKQELESYGVGFRTSSDTEVLLNALIFWGHAALPKLEGMFAFAFVDTQEEFVLLARDAFGIKPLYWSRTESGFAFSSEIQSLERLLPSSSKVNENVAATYLVFGWHDFSNQTFFDGIESLPPASSVTISLKSGASKEAQWWNLPISQTFEGSFEEASEAFRDLLLESVALHMRSDVPVGAALSGGIDSSSIVSVMRLLEPSAEIHTFSYVDPDPATSEEVWIDLINLRMKTIPHKVSLSAHDLTADDLKELVRAQAEPFVSSSIFAQYKVFQLANRVGIKVTLDGQGADEMLAGYHGYPEHYIRSLLDKGEFAEALTFAWEWQKWPGRSVFDLFAAVASNTFPNIRNSNTLMSLATELGLIPPQGSSLLARETSFPKLPAFQTAPENKGRRLMEELRNLLSQKRLSQLMRVADRNSMRWSVESRVPFLTKKLAEFIFSLPENYLISDRGETKRLLRSAMRGIVPDEILDRRDKVGFRANSSEWLTKVPQPRSMFKGLELLALVDHEKAFERASKMLDGKTPFDDLGWRLLCLSIWAESSSSRKID